MEKVIESGQPESITLLSCTPDQLKLIADRLEAEARNTGSEELVSYRLSSSVILVYKPDRKFSNQAERPVLHAVNT